MTGWSSPRSPKRFPRGMTNLAVVEAPNPEMEALAIAIAMREARHLDKTAALVTPDRALARRVMAALDPLESRIRRFRRRCADGYIGRHFCAACRGSGRKGLEPPTLLALLKHPLFRLGAAHGALKRAIEVLELALLRGTRPQAGCIGLARDFDRFRTELRKLRNNETSSLHAFEQRAQLKDDELDRAQALIAALQKALSPLESVASSKPHDFAELAQRHREVVDRRCRATSTAIAVAFEEQPGHRR